MEWSRDFIISLLDQKKISYRVDGGFAYILCPFHDDHDPSLRIFLQPHGKWTTGFFKCFACSANGDFYRIGSHYGIDIEIERKKPWDEKSAEIFREIEELTKPQVIYEIPQGLQEWVGGWRRIPAEFLQKIGCKRWYDNKCQLDRLWIPIAETVGKYSQPKLIGHVAARPEGSDAEPKYLNSVSLDTRKTLFGIEWLAPGSKVVLVEGPYDCLRLQAEGIPAVAILGTGNWSQSKLERLRTWGAKQLLLGFDTDRAGEFVAEMAYEDAKDSFDVRAWVWKHHDAGDADDKEISQLKKFLSSGS